VWWRCLKERHEWEATVSSRSNGNGCPVCSGQKVLSGFNDLWTKNKSLAQQWHPTKNGQLKPTHVTCGTDKKVWWLGESCKHEWLAAICDRSKGYNCPRCVLPTSKMETALHKELQKTFPDLILGRNLLMKWGKSTYTSVDILFEKEKVVIEYDGWYWHKERVDKDTLKTQTLLDAGYKVIRVRAEPLDLLEIKHKHFAQVTHPRKLEAADAIAKEIVSLIKTW
jgi:very-short-patch-repair endonuclease